MTKINKYKFIPFNYIYANNRFILNYKFPNFN